MRAHKYTQSPLVTRIGIYHFICGIDLPQCAHNVPHINTLALHLQINKQVFCDIKRNEPALQSQYYEKKKTTAEYEYCIEHEKQRMNTHAVNLYGAAATLTGNHREEEERRKERKSKEEGNYEFVMANRSSAAINFIRIV